MTICNYCKLEKEEFYSKRLCVDCRRERDTKYHETVKIVKNKSDKINWHINEIKCIIDNMNDYESKHMRKFIDINNIFNKD